MFSFFTQTKGIDSHFVRKGEGPVIVLFHASPLSSHSLMPLIDKLAKNYTVIAPDTPGYGKSSCPQDRPSSISFYCEYFKNLFQKIGLGKFAIYGTATGAQIAIRYALTYPDQVEHLFLDNSAHFTDEERDRIMESYFPDFTPVQDGKHLIKIWQTVENLFQYFPWCFKTAEHKLDSPMPNKMVRHAVSLEYINTAATYDWAYRLAFEHEKKEYVDQLKVPTLIFRWDNSILKSYTDRLFVNQKNIFISEFPIRYNQDRYKMMDEAIKEHYHSDETIQEHKFKNNSYTEVTLPIKEVVKKFPDFPAIEEKGEYLIEAWNAIENYCEISFIPKEKNDILFHWAQRT